MHSDEQNDAADKIKSWNQRIKELETRSGGFVTVKICWKLQSQCYNRVEQMLQLWRAAEPLPHRSRAKLLLEATDRSWKVQPTKPELEPTTTFATSVTTGWSPELVVTGDRKCFDWQSCLLRWSSLTGCYGQRPPPPRLRPSSPKLQPLPQGAASNGWSYTIQVFKPMYT